MEIDSKRLEDSLNSMAREKPKETKIEMSPQEEIGFHKGALNTLVAERAEMIKIVGTVEAIMQSHLKRLKDLGVDLGRQ